MVLWRSTRWTFARLKKRRGRRRRNNGEGSRLAPLSYLIKIATLINRIQRRVPGVRMSLQWRVPLNFPRQQDGVSSVRLD